MDKLIGALLKQALIHLTTWLKPQLINRLYEGKVQELKVEAEKLKKVRDDVQYNAYVEKKNLNGREIPVEVEEWIKEVESITRDYEAFDGDIENHELAVFDVFTSGFLPKPGIRCRRSIKARDITRRVNEYLRRAEDDVFSYWINPPFLPPFLSNISFHRFPSRDETLKKIKVALEDSNVRIVGLHGFSGVGKTTLVKQVAKEALQAKLFDVVIMADVTKNPDVRKIQGQIAEMLRMTLNEESDIARATQIGERLKKEKSMLIILDDLWEKIDFNMLGIPSHKDNILESVEEGKSLDAVPETHLSMMRPKKHPVASNKMTNSRDKGCKVLLISETKQVLLSQMEGKGNSISYVNVLDEKDAKWLFEHTAGISDGNSEYGKLAAQIASQCKGLPMVIITTAKALKHQSRSRWEDALQNLESQKLIGVSEFSTKLSYDILENEELKYTFLLCARMDNDALIMDLVKYCIGFGFLQGVCTVKEVRDRVYSLVVKLKEFGLLSDSYSSDHFTMQDIVRSAAFSIASQEGKHLLTKTKGKVDEWPDEDLLERYFAISLQYCDLIEGFPISINCPKLRVFQVDNNDPHLEIPTKFFEGMKELRVLILTGISLSPSDSSISCLKKLRMLCLEHCMLDEDLSILGELTKLRILSLSGSDVKKLPAELKKLTKLQILDISNCSKLLKIPSGAISSLINLEELYMRNTLIQWKVEEQTNQSENASLSELRHLNHLKALDIQFPKVEHLPKDLFFDMLHSYKIVIGDLNTYLETNFKMPEKYETSRFLGIHLKDGFDIHSQINIKMLFDGVENLLLGDLNGVQDIFYGLNLKGFPYLKHLSIRSNSNIKSLVNPKHKQHADPKHKQHAEKVFPELESLYLYNLNNMVNICSSKLSETSFGKLKVIKINLCGKLKNIFLFSVVKLLIILETIEVSECDSLKDIVFVESDNENETLTFRELRTLTLQSLSAFIGFYPISSTKRELFHKQVRVSKLERMELSSIPIDKIWSDQPSLSTHFGNLIQLEVNGCCNLKSLLSFSMAESLVNLQRLSISDSEKMGHIFSQEQGSNVKIEGSIFPNLKNIKLSNMKSLQEIWNIKLPLDSFGKLDTLTIEECDKFVSVFPCFMKGALQSLYYLSVTNCRSMNVIFDLDGGKQDTGVAPNLQDVHLEALPKLKHVWKWNKDQVVNFEKLQKICVRYCHSLMNIFPNSVTKFQSLKHLVLQDCFELREIVAKEEATGTNTPGPLFEFPELTTIKLCRLPKLNSFYPGAYDFSCPALIDLSIELCKKLEPFIKEIADVKRASILFPEEVINKLKYMQIESEHVKSSHSYMGEMNYRRHNLEELHLSGLKDTEVLYAFLHSNPDLKSLSLNSCSFEKMVPDQTPPEIKNMGVVPRLKSLKLVDLPNLDNIGFERDIALQRIESLILKTCSSLSTIMPSSVSLTYLTNLEVVNCAWLESIMPSSTAKSLVQLSTMKVIKCKSLKEIVRNEEENVGKVVIVFKQLKALELTSLKQLESFSSSINSDFEFPSLEKVVVSACPRMTYFSKTKVKRTRILQKVYLMQENENRWDWDDNLDATIRKIFKEKRFFEGMEELIFYDHVELKEAWNGKLVLQNNWFYSLTTLKLVDCEIQRCAIPSNVLPYLKSLKELEVRACHWIQFIFEMNGVELMGTTFQLKKLILVNLIRLQHVWETNQQGILSFRNLQHVFVSNCESLQTLFPAALAKNLKKLEKLDIENCDKLLGIVGKGEEAILEGTEFVLPCLTSLHLDNLPQLIYFYPETFTLECLSLNYLIVYDCGKLELFQFQQEGEHEGEGSVSRKPMFSDLKAISNLEDLTLEWKHSSALSLLQLTEGFQYLNELSLIYNGKEMYKQPTLPFEIFEKAPNLETITINGYSMLSTQKHKIGEDGILGHLKILSLSTLYELQSIDSNALLKIICEKLHQLYVSFCPNLETFVHSAGSFSYLKVLCIIGCHNLKSLFSPSVAKEFMLLEEITVLDCKSIKEIVAKEPKGATSTEEIKFERLDCMTLESLSCLECFYPGDNTLQLPSLIKVGISHCPKLEFFSRGTIHAKSFRVIQPSLDAYDDDLVFDGDLNKFIQMVVFQQQKHLTILGNSSVNWLEPEEGKFAKKRFRNLISLVLEGINILSNVILPSHLLASLSNLEELQVLNCNFVVAIFDLAIVIHIQRMTKPLSHLKSSKDCSFRICRILYP